MPSSDDEHMIDDDEEVEEYDFDEGIQDIPDHFNRPVQAPRAAPPPVLAPMAGGFNPFHAMRGVLGHMAGGAGWGGHDFAVRPPDAYNAVFTAYSTAILEVEQDKGSARYGMAGSGRDNVNFGGKSAFLHYRLLVRFISPEICSFNSYFGTAELDIEGPWMFTLTNPNNTSIKTHAGVLEFIAREGIVHLPQWMMQRLQLSEGDRIRIKGARLPKGKFIKLQPQSVDFLELSDPKAVLENALRNFAALTQGDIIEIAHNNINFSFLIMEAQPSAEGINVIDTDLEVDFAPPVGYVEPERKPKEPPPTMASKLGIKTSATVPQAQTPSTSSIFTGQGNSLGGKRVKGKGIEGRKIEDIDEKSRILRTDRPRVVTADTPDAHSRVPAALNLPFGTLFFGYPVVPLGDSTNVAATPASAFATAGQGASLNGRTRTTARLPTPSSPPVDTRAAKVGFAGQGQSLSGRSAPEVIDLD